MTRAFPAILLTFAMLAGGCAEPGGQVPADDAAAGTVETEPEIATEGPEGPAPPPETSGGATPPGPAAATPPARLTPPADRALRAAFLIVDGVYNTELVAPFDVLEHTRVHTPSRGKGPGIEVFTVSPDGEPVETAEGLTVTADYGFDDHPEIDLLIVPSAEGSRDRDLENQALIDWVRRVGGEADYVMSLCWGAFVLAEAGLLDGRAATTFPSDYERFAERFPKVDLRVNVSFVHDDRLLTSEGGVKSFDVAMYLVDHLYGPEVAAGIGGGLLIPWPPGLDQPPRYVVHNPPPPAG